MGTCIECNVEEPHHRLECNTGGWERVHAEVAGLRAQVDEHEDHCRRVAAIVAEAGHHVTCEPADGVRTMANELEELRDEALRLTDHELKGLRSLLKDLQATWVRDHQKDGLRALARHLEARKAGG